MPTNVQNDAGNIRKLIREAEGLSDEIMIACAKLKQAMVLARQNPEITLATGQKALIRLTEAENQAVGLSSNLFRVHEELNRVVREHSGLDDGKVTPLEGHAPETERSTVSA